jgi:hypothetical protein
MINLFSIHESIVVLFSLQEGPVVVVADTYNRRLALWHLHDGTVWKHLDSECTHFGLYAVAVTRSGALVVTNTHRVQVMTVDGAVLCILSGVGFLGSALFGVAVFSGTNDIFVTDIDNHRVVALTYKSDTTHCQYHANSRAIATNGAADGRAVARDSTALVDARAWGSQGTQLGQFSVPYGIVLTSTGTVWVADAFNHRLSSS